MGIEIPLFPLGTALFPHMPMRLRIFEQRYRDMMRDCTAFGTSFGIVGIREGVEAGGATPAPYPVGTLARIRSVEELEDGGYHLIVSGASRFRVGGIALRAHPYLVADITYLEDVTGDPGALERLAPRVASAFMSYTRTLGELHNEPATDVELPDDPELLSYLVAASLQIEPHYKQALLAVDSAETRLRMCLTLLRREGVLLDHSLARPERRTTALSPN